MKQQFLFACGAKHETKEPLTEAELAAMKKDSRERLRLAVYDSEPGCRSPVHESTGERALCLLGCPCKKEAARRQTRAWRSDGQLNPPRYVVTCFARVTEIEDDERQKTKASSAGSCD